MANTIIIINAAHNITFSEVLKNLLPACLFNAVTLCNQQRGLEGPDKLTIYEAATAIYSVYFYLNWFTRQENKRDI